MEKTIRKLFVVGCLFTAMGVSLTAASSHAVTTTGPNAATTGASATSKFSLTVDKAIVLSSVTSPTVTATSANVAPGKISATVQSNTGFRISLSAATPALTSGSDTIPASSTVVAGTSGWGVQKSGSTAYTALTTSPVEFYSQTTSKPTAGAVDINFGVAVSKAQAPGTYSTTVTVTAANI